MRLINPIAIKAWASGLKTITARCGQCQRSLTLRHFSDHKAGIKMRGRWYCSSYCFAVAAEKEIAELLASGLEPANHVARMPLGLMLISRGLLTSAEFKEVSAEQKNTGEEIGELLVRRGFVSEEQVTAVRANQWSCPVFTAPKVAMQTKIHIPSTFMRPCSMIPLHYVEATNLLLVGFVYGVEYELLYAIEKMAVCKTEPCFVTPSYFQIQMQQREQMQKQHEDADCNELKFESVHTAVEMAQILCNYCVHLEVDEVIIGKCKEYLWARLKCDSKEVDLLFKAW